MIKKHGNRQIDYSKFFEISKENKRENYDVDIWFFIPTSLITEAYTKENFFKDFTTYTRYNAPNISLNSLNDFTNKKNPLTRLRTLVDNKDNFFEVEYELKTLLNTFKVSSEKMVNTITAMKKFSSFEAEQNLKIQIERLNNILYKLLEIKEDSIDDFTYIFNLTLEGLSLRIEKTLYKIYKIHTGFREQVLAEIRLQRKFRESQGFITISSVDEKINSKIIFREHMIKKWSESIMYINMESSKTQSGLNHLFLGSAAALAMFITGVFTIVAAKVWGNDSLYLFITALILYSLKDRFKDIFKPLFLKRMNRMYADRMKTIISPINKRRCGKSMESVSFPKHRDINKDVQKLRFDLRDDFFVQQHQEDIIHYKKRVKISTSKLHKNHTRLFGIREIMRYDLRRWFYKMDKDSEKCYIPNGNTLEQVDGDREYNFNVILKIKSSNHDTLKRYKVIANSKRIKSIYTVN